MNDLVYECKDTMTTRVTITKQHFVLYKLGLLETLDIIQPGHKSYIELFIDHCHTFYYDHTLNQVLDHAPFTLDITR